MNAAEKKEWSGSIIPTSFAGYIERQSYVQLQLQRRRSFGLECSVPASLHRTRPAACLLTLMLPLHRRPSLPILDNYHRVEDQLRLVGHDFERLTMMVALSVF
ncbi:hypothetical protein EVAR_80711_1 [Eumeta japonica]|uniref:Uncharacterized protein n=1 Tax=Eumeta variegata TaxID=151549 RepID=A0A4C1U3J9_EUMVA|nr:hypothetical protein EVAR_80711_1 [Eumeta japonica]